jgi:hypothetical protein
MFQCSSKKREERGWQSRFSLLRNAKHVEAKIALARETVQKSLEHWNIGTN